MGSERVAIGIIRTLVAGSFCVSSQISRLFTLKFYNLAFCSVEQFRTDQFVSVPRLWQWGAGLCRLDLARCPVGSHGLLKGSAPLAGHPEDTVRGSWDMVVIFHAFVNGVLAFRNIS